MAQRPSHTRSRLRQPYTIVLVGLCKHNLPTLVDVSILCVDGRYNCRYDGHHVIVEYDEAGSLLRKYIYGPGIDEPICMVETTDSNALYYYHYDGLGSVIALSDANGTTVETYEYSVYGDVVANMGHPNPYLVTGRRLSSVRDFDGQRDFATRSTCSRYSPMC